ncbi:Ribose import ATP-binding protein RbsA [Lentibacillus sp. JNUCC-1]|uniref:ATP-binding cassette domain-containing protein n=1 Tax=Lentibacillus sp. JNUCC-1 TaxID=2654513 RepID=UPI0012E742CF|nr:ABC transporter ATP-binding protein [Lentibacillus sp. JNUCC-1]MUV38307.1 Ribose import ATP-binding protein RbsA [Lentibacillus sp. JNUCC-1]
MEAPIIQTKTLGKTFHSNYALWDLTIEIKPNTITGLIGRNGAGKTTLLKILAGFLKETSGEAMVFGKRPFTSLDVSANSILVDDHMVFPDALTLGELLKEGERFYHNWDMEFAQKLMTYFALPAKQKHKRLSKGKKTTFNIIFGLASRSPLTILDEPTTGMDASVRKDFYRLLLKDYLAHPRTIIVSSHYLNELDHMLEDVLLLDEGKKVLHLPIEELQEYAVRLTGPSAVLGQWLYDKTVHDKKQIATETMQAVVKRDFPIDQAEKMGIQVAPISPSDACIYLTAKAKGGIDDVFK